MALDPDRQSALDRVSDGLAAMGSGDPQPYADCWAESPDATLFGAWGPNREGPRRRHAHLRVGRRRFSGGPIVPEYDVVRASGDLAYTVGFERGTVSVDGGEPFAMTIRVTHVSVREDGAWRIVHRHADFPPADQRVG
jgi:ketosteroid isomerase-like protein